MRRALILAIAVIAIIALMSFLSLPSMTAETFAAQEVLGTVTPLLPDVHPDRTVGFHVMASRASRVAVFVDTMSPTVAVPMTRDERGQWSGALGPLDPDIYSYGYVIDGAVTGVGTVLIPGDAPQAWEPRKVPHGTLHIHWYDSASLRMQRSFWVYTPPGYERSKITYPTLYLLHGSGGNETGWVTIGAANVILDNVIADGKAKPMVVVMPFGHPEPSQQASYVPSYQGRDMQGFQRDLFDDIMPIVEKTYRVAGQPDKRAIAGLSMGGNQARLIGLSHLETFKWVASFSGSFSAQGPVTADAIETQFAGILEDPIVTNHELRLLWIGCGTLETNLLTQTKLFTDALTKHQIKYTFVVAEGGHTFHVWRRNLRDLLPLLFR
jgi:enterochelin esterase family protein